MKWDDGRYVFQVGQQTAFVPMTAETRISTDSTWAWAALCATSKDEVTGAVTLRIDNALVGRVGAIELGASGRWTYGSQSDVFTRYLGSSGSSQDIGDTGGGAGDGGDGSGEGGSGGGGGFNAETRTGFSGSRTAIHIEYQWSGPERPARFDDAQFSLSDFETGMTYTGTGTLTVTDIGSGESDTTELGFCFDATPAGGGEPIRVEGNVTTTSAECTGGSGGANGSDGSADS